MRIIQRQTLTYDAQEDRLRLASRFEDGEEQVFWLTRRLADRLVGALCQALEAGTDGDTPEHREALLAWEQEAAQAALEVVPPVTAGEAEMPSALVHTIDFVPHANGQQLVFKAQGCEEAGFALDGAALRQWLHILHQAYRQGGWDGSDLWPDWMSAPEPAPDLSVPAGTVWH